MLAYPPNKDQRASRNCFKCLLLHYPGSHWALCDLAPSLSNSATKILSDIVRHPSRWRGGGDCRGWRWRWWRHGHWRSHEFRGSRRWGVRGSPGHWWIRTSVLLLRKHRFLAVCSTPSSILFGLPSLYFSVAIRLTTIWFSYVACFFALQRVYYFHVFILLLYSYLAHQIWFAP